MAPLIYMCADSNPMDIYSPTHTTHLPPGILEAWSTRRSRQTSGASQKQLCQEVSSAIPKLFAKKSLHVHTDVYQTQFLVLKYGLQILNLCPNQHYFETFTAAPFG